MTKLTFGQKLMILRKNKNLSQKKLAEILKIGVANLARYETGISSPNIKTIITLSNFFNVSIDYLVKDDDIVGTIHRDEDFLKIFKKISQIHENELLMVKNMFNSILDGVIKK